MNNNIKILIARAMDQLGCDKDNIDIEVNRTSDSAHGDFYTNIAMKLAKILKKNLQSLHKIFLMLLNLMKQLKR